MKFGSTTAAVLIALAAMAMPALAQKSRP